MTTLAQQFLSLIILGLFSLITLGYGFMFFTDRGLRSKIDKQCEKIDKHGEEVDKLCKKVDKTQNDINALANVTEMVQQSFSHARNEMDDRINMVKSDVYSRIDKIFVEIGEVKQAIQANGKAV